MIESTLFIKPTDICTLLQASSFHPTHCEKGIIYSQALRYRRLITNDKELGRHLYNFKINLIKRGYDPSLIDNEFAKISKINQNDLLFPNQNNQQRRPNPTSINEGNNQGRVIPFIVPYYSETTEIGSILSNHWHLIRDNPVLQQVWNRSRPILSLQRRPNLKDKLVRTKFPPY